MTHKGSNPTFEVFPSLKTDKTNYDIRDIHLVTVRVLYTRVIDNELNCLPYVLSLVLFVHPKYSEVLYLN